MSATIGWRPVENNLTYLNEGSSFAEVLRKAFGKFPIELAAKDIPVLKGIAAANYDEAATELMEAIYVHEKIQVEVEY